MLAEAGFRSIEVVSIEDDFFNNYYIALKG
jgi:hypothetical protein